MDAIKKSIASLPSNPGIYRFYNREGVLIYIGKAKNIRKRVGSYFVKQNSHSQKTKKLVSEILKIESTIVQNEYDALLLENNFIKQYQPKYNILLKDDKTFPFICILHERFPRIISTRKHVAKQGEYFGPYTSVLSMKNVLGLIRQLYTIRTCSFSLTKENIEQNKFKVCLEYHIGNCLGPCAEHQSEPSYLEEIAQCRNILKGNLSVVRDYLHSKMKFFADRQHYEKAELYKNRLELLTKYQSKSMVVNKKISEVDVITITSNSNQSFVNYLQVKEGSIIFSKNITVKKLLEEKDEEVLGLVYLNLRSEYHGSSQTIFSNLHFSLPQELEVFIPKIGDKKKLVHLSLKNALYQKGKALSVKEEKQLKKEEPLFHLQTALRLTEIPRIIECFDNSNFQGTSPVASMVRFTHGQPDKKNYRHFNIKTVTGANDFASMKEIVHRRYHRMIEEKTALPQLIIIDGGKGQLSSAQEALTELGLHGSIPIIGVAKKLEEIYFPEDPIPLMIHKKSPALHLIQRIRDEAHRFAITFHRLKRSKNSLESALDQIPGIGEKSLVKLMQVFKTKKNILNASEVDLEKIIGKKKAEIIKKGA